MDKIGACAFLNEDQLCSIQLELGPEYLSHTCRVYPRVINQVNQVVEKSTTMSCPEAARLALLNKEKMEFDQIMETIQSKEYMEKSIDTEKGKLLQQFFWDFRILTIKILQNRTFTIEERLILLGMFYNQVQKLIDEGKTDEIVATINRYTMQMQDQTLKETVSKLATNLAFQMKLCKELLDYRIAESVTSKRYVECLDETLKGLDYYEETEIEHVLENYKQGYQDFYSPFMEEHEHILENYLVNYAFQLLFPFDEDRMFDSYIMLIVHFSMLKLHLIGMANHHKGLSEELIIKLIQSFSKTVDHNKPYLQRVIKLIKENNYNEISYMAILIKS